MGEEVYISEKSQVIFRVLHADEREYVVRVTLMGLQ